MQKSELIRPKKQKTPEILPLGFQIPLLAEL
jgi:hypothetical protein